MDKRQKSAARFFLRVAQAGTAAKVYDEETRPLFPLPLLMQAEGTLAPDAARRLYQTERR
jgi:hypothetical protein